MTFNRGEYQFPAVRERTMLTTVMMAPDRLNRQKKPDDLPPTNGDLRRVVQVIVNEFGGDTVAYYNSIRPESSRAQTESEHEEARIARRFAKST